MAISETASKLGGVAAELVKRGELALGVVGWLGACFFLAELISRMADLGFPSIGYLFRELSWLALSATMLGASIWLRTPSRWFTELGFNLGLKAAVVLAVLAVFLSDESATGAFILGAEFSAALGGIAAWFHWDQVEDAMRKLRLFLTGTSRNPDWSTFHYAFEPLLWFAWFVLAATGALVPDRFEQIGGPRTMDLLDWAFGGLPLHMPGRGFWLLTAALCAARLYIAFRRVGFGFAKHGFFLWLFSFGEIAGALIVCGSIYVQLTADGPNRRLITCVIALSAAALAWFCDVRRRRLIGC